MLNSLKFLSKRSGENLCRPGMHLYVFNAYLFTFELVFSAVCIISLQLPSSLISESASLLNGGKFSPVGALASVARYFHATRQTEYSSSTSKRPNVRV